MTLADRPAQGDTGSQTGGGSSQTPQEAPRTGSQTALGQQDGGQAQPQPTGGTPEATGAGGGGQGAQGRGAETGQGTTTETDEDPEAILERHPRLKRYVDSRVGDLAQRQATTLAETLAERRYNEYVADQQREQALRTRRHLRQTDPDAFAKWDEEQDNAWTHQQETATRAEQLAWQRLDTAIGSLQSQLPFEVQQIVGGKKYEAPDRNPITGRLMYLQAMIEAAVDHGVSSKLAPALQKAKAEMAESQRLQANGHANGNEPRANVDGGVETGRGEYVSQQEFDQYGRGHTPAARQWRKDNAERLQRSYHRTITH
jgi:hypothetical protein